MEKAKITAADLAQLIDHTLLRPDAETSDFERLCREAVQYEFKAVCVNSARVAYVSSRLAGKGVGICSVVGFPLGATESGTKAFEARQAVADGASELDMVMNIGLLKSGDLHAVAADIRSVRRSAPRPTLLKVIIETCLLTEAQKVQACKIAVQAGADFVKTSTGFSTAGATVDDVALMRRTVGEATGVKASGGIKNLAMALAMVRAGADRLGVSAGAAIMEEAIENEKK